MDSTEKLELLAGFDALGLVVTRLDKDDEGEPVAWIGTRMATGEEWAQARLAAARRAKRMAVGRLRDAKIGAGFPYNFEGEIGVRTFDLRSASDEAAWTRLQRLADALVAAGAPDDPVEIRDASNARFLCPAHAASAAVTAMDLWRQEVLSHAWDLKDLIEQAPDHAALASIDIILGWP